MRTFLSLCIASLFAASAFGQYPGGYLPGPGYGGSNGGSSGIPGLYGGGLSPYLNLRGRNISSAINYFNFTRPYTGGTFGNAFMPTVPQGMPFAPGGGSRFFPNALPVYADEDVARQRTIGEPDKDGLIKVDMPPAGHGGGFMNTMGYFGSPGGMQGAAGRPAASLGRPRAR